MGYNRKKFNIREIKCSPTDPSIKRWIIYTKVAVKDCDLWAISIGGLDTGDELIGAAGGMPEGDEVPDGLADGPAHEPIDGEALGDEGC